MYLRKYLTNSRILLTKIIEYTQKVNLIMIKKLKR